MGIYFEGSGNEAAGVDYEVACLVARSGQMVKGYGDTRRTTARAADRFVSEILTPLIALDRAHGEGRFALTLALGAHCRRLIGRDENGIEEALALTAELLGRARTLSYGELLAEVEGLRVS